jgi:hypothetical protein
MAAYLRWCGFLARSAVEKNWAQIGRFAQRLADAGELRGSELKAVLSSACRPAPIRERSRGKR